MRGKPRWIYRYRPGAGEPESLGYVYARRRADAEREARETCAVNGFAFAGLEREEGGTDELQEG